MKPLRLMPLAEADLEERAAYLESRRRGYARRFLAAFDRTARRIARAPGAIARYGSEHPQLTEMRITGVDKFPNLVVLFRITETAVEILRIVHGSQDLERIADEILPE